MPVSSSPAALSPDRSQRNWLLAAWLFATCATITSIFFSEVLKFPPCVLCWYQRVTMYPLAIILFVGVFPFQRNVVRFALPFAVIGWGLAFYHTLLYYHLLPGSKALCEARFSCTSQYLEWFGFLTIPLMSLATFTILLLVLVPLLRSSRGQP